MDFNKFCWCSNLSNDDLETRSENGYGFQRSGMRTGVRNDILGLKQVQDLENWMALTHEEFPGVIPRGQITPFSLIDGFHIRLRIIITLVEDKQKINLCTSFQPRSMFDLKKYSNLNLRVFAVHDRFCPPTSRLHTKLYKGA